MNNTYMFLLLLGSYYGFLATLPLGPSKLLCVRNFLITTKGSKPIKFQLESAQSILIAGISGLIVAQVIILLSVYSPSLYVLWLKPHTFNLLFLPVLFFYWHKIRLLETDTYNDELLGTNNLSKIRIQTAFLETLFIQLLNPIVFPNAVFSRLIGVFLFRYSNLITFVGGILLGILGGYGLFLFSTLYLVERLEKDTPTIYRLVKRVIHQAFFPVFFIICLVFLGRSPIPSIKNFSFNKESWQEKPWPDIFYSYDTWKRPVRFLKNNKTNSTEENIRAFNKMYFSQYFFEIYKKDGQQKLYHNAPQSLSIVSRDLNKLLDIPSISEEDQEKIFDQWIQDKETRKVQIQKSIQNRLISLKQGGLLEGIVEKKLGSISYNGNILSKEYDPRLGLDTRENKLNINNKSPLLLTDANLKERTGFLSSDKTNLLNIYTKNRLKLFFTTNLAKYDKLPKIEWQKEKILIDKEVQNIELEDFNKENWSIDKIESLKNENIQSWNNILYKIQKLVKSNKEISNATNFLGSQQEDYGLDNSTRFINMYKLMPSWNSKISRTDLQKPGSKKFSSVLANFVRHLLPGSMRARRRKALSWNAYQNQPHAPIFLRAITSLNLDTIITTEENTTLLFKKKNENQQSVHILKTRWNFPIAHFVRGIALCGQAYIRRYIKLPTLIILKNISRQILLQSTEWQKDWTNLAQEVYVDCDYDGNDLYVGVKLPNILELKGKQVKIIRPFRLKYSQSSISQETHSREKNVNLSNLSAHEIDNYSYLTIWGDETFEPFGKIKQQAPFIQPILQRINLILRHKIYKKYNACVEQFQWIKKYQEQLVHGIANLNKNLFSFLQKKPQKEDNALSIITRENISDEDMSQYLENKKNIRSSSIDIINKEKLVNKKTKLNHKSFDKNISLSDNHTNQKEESKDIKTINTNNNLLVQENIEKQIESKLQKINTKKLNHQSKKLRKSNFQNSIIYLQQNLFHLKRSIIHIQKNITYNFHQKKTLLSRDIIKTGDKLFELVQEFVLTIRKFLIYINTFLLDLFNGSLVEIRKFGKKSSNESNKYVNQIIKNSNEIDNKTNLSQAYVLHKIWQENAMNRPILTDLIKTWNEDQLLNKNIHNYLDKQGILENQIPENLQYIEWEAWLKKLPGYRPSLKIWRYVIPQYWSQSVRKYWKESKDFPLSIATDKYNIFGEKEEISNYLSYHTPLLEKAEKFTKLSKFYRLAHNYTNYANDADVDNLSSLSTNGLLDNLTKDIQDLRIEDDLLKELPIIQKEIERINSNIELSSIPDRLSYPASRQNKWKSKELKNRFRNLMKAAKQRNVLKESMIEKKHMIEIPDQMRKDLEIFYQSFQPEDILFISILENWRYKFLDDELFMYNILSSFLRFNEKEQKDSLIKYGPSHNFSQSLITNRYPLLPEELLLPQSLRELRILESLDLEQSKDEYEKGNQFVKKYNKNVINKTNQARGAKDHKISKDIITNKDVIMRFLWPSHRIEDLACMNRFWLGTANQSRFSLLRIRSFL